MPLQDGWSWLTIRAHFEVGTPIVLACERGGEAFEVEIVPRQAPGSEWGPPRIASLALRVVQLAGLALAFVIAWRKPQDLQALLVAVEQER